MPEETVKMQEGVEAHIEEVQVDREKGIARITIEPPDSYIYSNVAGVSVSPMDFRINFADASVDGKCKTVAGITLSPEHAAGLLFLLLRQLLAFEAQFGEVRNPQWKKLKDSSMVATVASTPKEDLGIE